MRQRPKSLKPKAKLPVAPKSPKNQTSKVRDLEKRFAAALKDKAEALEQQAATSEILQVISGSPTDVEPVFRAMAANAARLCDAFDATIFRVDGDVLRLVAHKGPIAPAPILPLTEGTLGGRVIRERRAVRVDDMQAESREYPMSSEIARNRGFRTVLSVPLLRGADAIGLIAIRRTEVRPFTDRQIALLKTFADQAVIAIENVRLFTELDARNAELTESLGQQTATGEILRVIASSPTDIHPVFAAVAESAARLCDSFDANILRRVGDKLVLVAHHGPIPVGPVGEFTIPVVRGTVAGRAVLERTPVHVRDMQKEEKEFPEGVQIARRHDDRTILGVPLMRDGSAIGVILLRRTEARLFTERQVALLKTFADQAVIAIENVRLFKELQEKNKALTEAHTQVSEALERQTATSEILDVISSSPTDVQPVFDAIAASATRLCDGLYSVVFRYDGEVITVAADNGRSAETSAVIRSAYPAPPGRRTLASRALLERRVIAMTNAQDSHENPDGAERARAMGYRAGLSVPMMRGDVAIGVINVVRVEAIPFTDTQSSC